MAKHDDSLDQYIQDSRAKFEAMLAQLVNIPTVSADPAHDIDIERGAHLAVDFLISAGFKAQVAVTDGLPIVYGEHISDPANPTVLIYNHLDVQPAHPEEWANDPFTLRIADDRYYGRGTTDDKGPALTAIFAVAYAIRNKLPLNFKVVWECEEEVGSTHFESFLKAQANDLSADSVLVSDSVWVSPDQPSIDYGLRGLITFEIRLQTAAGDTHSGLTGGVARNPLGELAKIISQCYDAQTGRVHVPGFYDDVRPIGESELSSLAESGFDAPKFIADFRLEKVRTDDLRQVVSRIMLEPTFEVHGLTGGYDGPGVKTVIPSRATAKLSARLVPGQHPEKMFELIKAHIKQLNPDVEVTLDATAEPFLADFDGPFANAARRATKYAFGKPPVFIREGGSIGAVVSMKRVLNLPVLLLGLSLPKHGYHAVNEFYDWGQASRGMKLFTKYFEEIAEIKTLTD